jgi:hypothetical protein
MSPQAEAKPVRRVKAQERPKGLGANHEASRLLVAGDNYSQD